MATWKNIPGYGGHYQASSDGRVRVKDRIIMKVHSRSGNIESFFYKGKELRTTTFRYGHKMVSIGVNGVKYTLHIGRLVLMAFRGLPPEGMECCHNNGDSGDNRLRNLRWDTHHNNNQDRKKHGRYASKEEHPMAKLSLADVKKIRRSRSTGKKLAEKFDVGQSQISRIKKGKSWRQ